MVNKMINTIYYKIILYIKSQYKYCFLIPFIFNKLGTQIPSDAEPIVQLCFNLFILSLICLVCFVNITGYFLSLYYLNKYDVEQKFPRFAKYIRFYEKSNIFFIYFEIVVCVCSLLAIILLNFFIIANFIMW